MSAKPQSAADPRPNGVPYYMDKDCPKCGSELVMYDAWVHMVSNEEIRNNPALEDPELDDSPLVWYDEWICPECVDGIHMDWPDRVWEELENREPATGTSIEELLNE